MADANRTGIADFWEREFPPMETEVGGVVVHDVTVTDTFEQDGEIHIIVTPISVTLPEDGSKSFHKVPSPEDIQVISWSVDPPEYQDLFHEPEPRLVAPSMHRPFAAAMNFDSSGSMGGSGGTDPRRLRVRAGKRFLQDLGPLDRAAVFDFGVGADNGLIGTRLLQDFTNDISLLNKAIGRVTWAGGTPLFTSVASVADHTDRSIEPNKFNRALLVFTDGEPNRDEILAHAVDAALHAKLPIIGVGLGPAAEGSRTEDDEAVALLKALSTQTGGVYVPALSADQLDEAFGQLGDQLFSGQIALVPKFKTKPPECVNVEFTINTDRGTIKARFATPNCRELPVRIVDGVLTQAVGPWETWDEYKGESFPTRTYNLVADKTTALRVFVSPIPGAPAALLTGEAIITKVDATGREELIGRYLPSPSFIAPIEEVFQKGDLRFRGAAITSRKAYSDGDQSSSLDFYFEIPAGSYRIDVTVLPYPEDNGTNPVHEVFGDFEFVESSWTKDRPLRVLVVDMHVRGIPPGDSFACMKANLTRDVATQFPVGDVEIVTDSQWGYWFWPLEVVRNNMIRLEYIRYTNAERGLEMRRGSYNMYHRESDHIDYVVGMLPSGGLIGKDPGNDAPGDGRAFGFHSTGAIIEYRECPEWRVGAHELGHCFGLHHTFCEDGTCNPLFPSHPLQGDTTITRPPLSCVYDLQEDIFALEIWKDGNNRTASVPRAEPNESDCEVTVSVTPPCYPDKEIGYLMDYTDRQWISREHYQLLFDKMISGEIGPGELGSQTKQLLPEESTCLSLSLLIGYGGDVVEMESVLRPCIDMASPQTGSDYELVVVDQLGGRLEEYPFSVDFADHISPDGGILDYVPAFFEIPWPDLAVGFRLLRDGQELLSRSVSANAPTVSVLSPTAGTTLEATSTTLIEWTGDDLDGDALSYSVYWSGDGGQTYSALITATTDTQLPVSGSHFGGTNEGVFKVVASDGFNTGEDTTDGFITVESHPPVAVIISPASGEAILQSRTLQLRGAGSDLEDGEINDASMEWTSDLDGPLGNSADLVTGGLMSGTHEIIFKVYDSQRNSATDSVVILLDSDRDGDGLPDSYEETYSGLDPDVPDALADADGDGLSNASEHQYGTRPDEGDTDGDGRSDIEEILEASDPLDIASVPRLDAPKLLRMLERWKEGTSIGADLLRRTKYWGQ